MFEGLQTELEEVTEALAEVIARWVLPLVLILIILDVRSKLIFWKIAFVQLHTLTSAKLRQF